MKRPLLLFALLLGIHTIAYCQQLSDAARLTQAFEKELQQQMKMVEKKERLITKINSLQEEINTLSSDQTALKAKLTQKLEAKQNQLTKLNQKINSLKKTSQALKERVAYLDASQLKSKALARYKKGEAGIKEKYIQKSKDDAELILNEANKLKEQLFIEAGLGLAIRDRVSGHVSSLLGMQLSEKFGIGLGGEFRNYLADGTRIGGLWSGKLMARYHVGKNWYLRVENYTGLPTVSSLEERKTLEKWAWAQMGGIGLSLPFTNGKALSFELLRTIHQNHQEIGNQLYSPFKAQLNFQF